MNNLVNISFCVDKKKSENCLSAIFIVLIHRNKRIRISTHILIPKNVWDDLNMRLKENSRDAMMINSRLTKLMKRMMSRLYRLYYWGKLNNLTTEELKLEILNSIKKLR